MITETVKDLAKEEGADLVGICSEDELETSEERVRRIMPDVENIIVVALRHFKPVFETDNIRMAQYNVYTLYHELDEITYQIAKFLDDNGSKAIPVSPYLPVEMSSETQGLVGDVSHRHAAVQAGLGEIGLNGLLITPEYGPRVRLASIVTDAELESDERFERELCTWEECAECVEACPANAIEVDGNVQVGKCAKQVLKHGVPGLMERASEFAEEEADWSDLKEFTADPDFWEIWQAATSSMFYDCFECVKNCPVGES